MGGRVRGDDSHATAQALVRAEGMSCMVSHPTRRRCQLELEAQRRGLRTSKSMGACLFLACVSMAARQEMARSRLLGRCSQCAQWGVGACGTEVASSYSEC